MLGANGLSILLSVAQLAILARHLGAERYGVLTIVMTYTATISQFLDSRAWEAAIAYVLKYREAGDAERAKAVIKLCALLDTVTGILASATVAVTAYWASYVLLPPGDSAALIRIYAWSLMFSIPVGISSALLRIGNRFDWIAYHSVATAAARLVLVLCAAWLGGGVIEVLWAYLASAAISAAVLLLMAHVTGRQLGMRGWPRVPLRLLKTEWRALLGFLSSTNVSAILKVLQRNGDILLLGALTNATAAGHLRAARSITDLINVPITPVYTASYPEFVMLWRQGNRQRLREVAARLTGIASLVAIGTGGVLLLGAPFFVEVILGSDYVTIVPLVRWLAVAMILAVATSTWHPLLLAMDQAWRSLAAIAVAVACQFVVFLAAVPSVGEQAAGMAYLVFCLAWIAVAGFGVRRGFRHV